MSEEVALTNQNNKSKDQLGGVPIDHVVLPNDVALACNYCDDPAVGAVQVEDPNNDKGKQTFVRACAKHKSKAMREARKVLKNVYQKRVIIDDTPEAKMGGINTSMGPGEAVNK